jgi:histidine triad (HIT) family protein
MTLFSRIIAGEIEAYTLAENERFLAFLDIFPAMHGHALVVPKVETDRLFDLPDEYLDGLLLFCKPVAHAIRQATGCNRVNILTLGFEVPHAHVHLLPMNGMADANISKKIQVTLEELQAMQQKIRSFL